MNHLKKGGEYSCQRRIKNQGVFGVVNSNDTNSDLLDAKKALVSRRACLPDCCILFANKDFTLNSLKEICLYGFFKKIPELYKCKISNFKLYILIHICRENF